MAEGTLVEYIGKNRFCPDCGRPVVVTPADVETGKLVCSGVELTEEELDAQKIHIKRYEKYAKLPADRINSEVRQQLEQGMSQEKLDSMTSGCGYKGNIDDFPRQAVNGQYYFRVYPPHDPRALCWVSSREKVDQLMGQQSPNFRYADPQKIMETAAEVAVWKKAGKQASNEIPQMPDMYRTGTIKPPPSKMAPSPMTEVMKRLDAVEAENERLKAELAGGDKEKKPVE